MTDWQTNWERGVYLFLISLTAMAAFVLFLVVQPLGANVTRAGALLPKMANGVCAVPGTHADIQVALNDPACTSLDIGSGVFTGTFTTTHSVTIQGQGADNTVIDGDRRHPVFSIQDGHEVTVSSLTIRDGWYNYIGDESPGGGILNAGILTVTYCFFENNRAMGGGIFNDDGNVLIDNSSFVGNSGAAIWNYRSGTVIIEDSTFLANETAGIENEGKLVVVNGSLITGTVSGRGITNDGHFVINHTTVSSNQSQGGIANSGVMTITDSTIDGNSVVGYGGGILQWGFSTDARLTISNTTISHNHATLSGGGIGGNDSIDLYNSTLVGNSADGDGGGFYGFGGGFQNITNSTISDNSVEGIGGGIYNEGTVLGLLHTTVYSNSAVEGGGLYNDGITTVDNSIVGKSGGGDCFISAGVVDMDGFNLDTDASCASATTVADLNIGPLADYGGATWTHLLLPDSPAVDSADDNLCLLKDQRGEDRPYDGDGDGDASCDIGSFELQGSDIPPEHQVFLPMVLK